VNANLARTLAGLALAAAFATWVAFKLHWESITVPVPAKGEALTNPYYALEHFAQDLGVHPREISTVRGLQAEAVLVLEESGDQLTRPPVTVLESWVEAGGRLVISSALLNSYPALRAWSGIKAAPPSRAPADAKPPAPPPSPHSRTDSGADCPLMQVRADGALTGQSFRVCDWGLTLSFDGERPPAWSLSDDRGMHVIRTGVGFGEITVLEPRDVLSNRMLKRADPGKCSQQRRDCVTTTLFSSFIPRPRCPYRSCCGASSRPRSCFWRPPCSRWPGATRRASAHRSPR
jgi:hypothetical protein